MKAYVITTGIVFGLLAIAHLWRIAAENRRLAEDPLFLLITAAAAGLCVWAFGLVRRPKG
jgi:H+/Cl- antiporter ClcA